MQFCKPLQLDESQQILQVLLPVFHAINTQINHKSSQCTIYCAMQVSIISILETYIVKLDVETTMD